MTSEAHAPATNSRPTRGVVRVLIPVLLNLAVLALMIGVGARRNQERIRAAEGGVDRSIRMIGEICDRTARSLTFLQDGDGSWSPVDTAITMRVLFSLKGTAYETDPLYEAGLGFVRERQETMEQTVERMSLGWHLLGADLVSPKEFRTFLQGRTAPDTADPAWIDANILLLGALPGLGMDASRLEATLREHLDRAASVSPAWWLRSAYLASLVAESGSPEAGILRDRMLDGWQSAERASDTGDAEPWEALDAFSLAAYVSLRAGRCLSDSSPCKGLDAPARTLLREKHFVRSDAEATSAVLNALTMYRRVLETRVVGQRRSS